MSIAYEATFVIRLALYGLRFALWVVYGFLQFFSKPGSRYIVPGLGAAWIVVSRPRDFLYLDSTIFFVVLWCIGTAVYVVLSKVLHVLLATFPPIGRPLFPQHRLEAGKRLVRPVPVQIAVPRLRPW